MSETLEALARRARELDSRIDLIEEAEASRASGFHVSLTRPVFLRSFQFEAFLRMIRERLRNAKRLVSQKSISARFHIKRFTIRFTLGLGRISSYPNSDGSRTFLAADVTVGAKQVNKL